MRLVSDVNQIKGNGQPVPTNLHSNFPIPKKT